jgi:hypothetical protein
MTRNEGLEHQFKRRYNRSVIIHRKVQIEDGEPVQATVQITYRGHNFIVVEKLVGGLTQTVTVTYLGKVNTFKTHLEAETFVADKIGEI